MKCVLHYFDWNCIFGSRETMRKWCDVPLRVVSGCATTIASRPSAMQPAPALAPATGRQLSAEPATSRHTRVLDRNCQ
jgi:hypothetical protein